MHCMHRACSIACDAPLEFGRYINYRNSHSIYCCDFLSFVRFMVRRKKNFFSSVPLCLFVVFSFCLSRLVLWCETFSALTETRRRSKPYNRLLGYFIFVYVAHRKFAQCESSYTKLGGYSVIIRSKKKHSQKIVIR